jgi:hypothetical protein
MPRRTLDPQGTCVACPAGDMTCPHEHPLDVLLEELSASGYTSHHDEIDARFARSGLVRSSNCGGRGCFLYRGVRRGRSMRAFWSCRRCGHWVEV